MRDIIERLREDPLRNFDEACEAIARLRIVEECYQTESADLRDELDGARTEIERLRKQVEARDHLLDERLRQRDDCQQEIEQLREKEATAEIIFETNKQQRAEIERLHKSLARLHKIIGTQEGEIERLSQQLESEAYSTEEAINKRDAEIGRLRDLVTRLSTLVDTERSLHDEEIKRLCDENSRLKQEICSQGLNWAKDAAEITQLRSDIVALQGMRQNAEAEVERLTAQAQRDYDHQQAQITRLNDLIDTERKHHSEWQKMAQEEIHGWMRKEAKLRELRANDDRIIKHFRSLHDETR